MSLLSIPSVSTIAYRRSYTKPEHTICEKLNKAVDLEANNCEYYILSKESLVIKNDVKTRMGPIKPFLLPNKTKSHKIPFNGISRVQLIK